MRGLLVILAARPSRLLPLSRLPRCPVGCTVRGRNPECGWQPAADPVCQPSPAKAVSRHQGKETRQPESQPKRMRGGRLQIPGQIRKVQAEPPAAQSLCCCSCCCCLFVSVCCHYANTLLCSLSLSLCLSWCLLISVNIPAQHTYLTHRFVSHCIVSPLISTFIIFIFIPIIPISISIPLDRVDVLVNV